MKGDLLPTFEEQAGERAPLHRTKSVIPCRRCAKAMCGFVTALAMQSSVLAAESIRPTMQSAPFRTPIYWGNLPRPDSRVRLTSPVGTFELPMGYVSNWYALNEMPVVMAPDGMRQFNGGLFFKFEYPGGGMNANPPGTTAVMDNLGGTLPGHTVVFVTKVGPPDPRSEDEIRTLDVRPPGRLVHNDVYSRSGDEYLDGVDEARPGHRIGVGLSCGGNCLFTFYLERHHLTLRGFFDGRFRHDGLAIAAQAQKLFENWQANTTGKGN